jgi:1-acyl-sn-glycerol-3-phosphate acyltransferase
VKHYDIDSLENRDPCTIARIFAAAEPIFHWYFRPDIQGLENIPRGAGLYVGNHNSGAVAPDMFIFAMAVHRVRGIDDMPYGLAHEVTMRIPLIHQLIVPLGAVRASHDAAHRVLAAGSKVLVYPGGDLDAFRPFRDRNRVVFGARRGYIKLALRENVPIIPVVAEGAHSTLIVLHDGQWLARTLRIDRLFRYQVFPVTLSVPWGLTIGMPLPHFPLPARIRIRVLDPIYLDRHGEAAADDRDYVEHCHCLVHGRMESTLQSLAQDRRAAGSPQLESQRSGSIGKRTGFPGEA